MKTSNEIAPWGMHSASFWMVFLVAAGIIFVGLRFLVSPDAGAAGFGVPFSSAGDVPFGWIKGIRDVFSGLVLLPLLLRRMRQAAAYVFTAAIIIPATDCLIVFAHNGLDLPHMLVHGLTAVYMVVTSVLLFRGR